MTSARRAATGPATDATNSPAKHAAEATPPPYLKQVVGGLAAIVVACLALPGASAVTGSASPLAPAASYAVPAAGLGTPSRGDVDSQLSRTSVRTPLADDRAATETTAATPDPSAAALPSESAPAATPEPAASTAAAPASPTALPTRTLYATVVVNARVAADPASAVVRQLAAGTSVKAVGPASGGWQQISLGGDTAYVASQYLATSAPATTAAQTTTAAKAVSGSYPACSSGSGVESGLTSRAISLHRAVCATFPSITAFGGWRGDGEHADGRALDVMASGTLGRAVANWARANAGALGIQTIIFEQKIWTQQRSSEGWRAMADRGSITANHYDHVHIQVL